MVSALLADEPCVGVALALTGVYGPRLAEYLPARTDPPEVAAALDGARGVDPPTGSYRQTSTRESCSAARRGKANTMGTAVIHARYAGDSRPYPYGGRTPPRQAGAR